jgi:hypothetical protein
MQKIVLYILILAILSLDIAKLSAAQIRGVYFHDSVTVADEVLEIRGAGLLRWLFFKIYIVALYLPSEIQSRNVLNDMPKRLEFHFFSSMKAEQFVESGEHFLLKNASSDELTSLRTKINAFNNLYRDVEEGERYSLTYIPGEGTELALNGKALGKVNGYDFASVYYRIWLGKKPVDDDLKRMLLNGGLALRAE